MQFVTYNIQYGKGQDGRVDLERTAAALEGADIIALQEVDRGLERTGGTDQPARIAELLPDYHAVFKAPLDLADPKAGPGLGGRRQHGLMLLSRWPILSARLLLLPRLKTYDKPTYQRGALEGLIETPDGLLRVYAVHLSHLLASERRLQLDYLLPKAFAVPNEGGVISGLPTDERRLPDPQQDFVVLGDFNLAPESAEYRRIVGEPDYYYGQVVTEGHLVDSWCATGHAPGEGITWRDCDSDAVQPAELRLDFAFVSPGLAGRVRGARIDNATEASDHYPFWMDLDL